MAISPRSLRVGGSDDLDDANVVEKGTALAAAAFRQLRGDMAAEHGVEEPPVKSRGWRILREYWEDFVHKRDLVPARVAADLASTVRPPPGPERPEMRKELFERTMDKLTNPMGAETPRTKVRMERWSKAKQMHSELKGQLTQLGWAGSHQSRSASPAGSPAAAAALARPLGQEARTAAGAAEAFFPSGWQEALTPELLADLIIDAFLPSFADGVLDEFAAQVEEECRPNPPPPPPRKLGGSRSTPGGFYVTPEKRRAVMPLPKLSAPLSGEGGGTASAPDLSSGHGHRLRSLSSSRRLLSPVNDHLRMPTTGFATLSPQRQAGGRDAAWASRPYFMSPQGVCGRRELVLQNSTAQRPHRRLQRKEETVGDTKYVAPMRATHFPEEWDRMTEKRVDSKAFVGTGFPGPADKIGVPESRRSSKDRLISSTPKEPKMEETEEMNPTWLIKNDAIGRSIFPYSLAAHRAFISSQPEEWLKEKALEAAPMMFTTWA